MNQAEILRKSRQADSRRNQESPKDTQGALISIDGWKVSGHAVDRFIERFGSTPENAPKRLVQHAEAGRKIEGGLIQSGSIVLVLHGKTIVTVFKPTEPHIHQAIYKANQ